MRIGQGIDVHRFSDDATRELWLGLIHLPGEVGLAGHSDADVVVHALIDALLGAANLGDIGRLFPDDDENFSGIASRTMLLEVLRRLNDDRWRPISVDVTIVAERPRLAAYMPEMSQELSVVVGCVVSVKATTAEGLGALGRAQGIAATAIALLEELP
ncbi:MAG TPA: 2-C-methyl-D-erythritol 2,4-cyclodiphosphate synthase [Acidimicrobiales bacterium]